MVCVGKDVLENNGHEQARLFVKTFDASLRKTLAIDHPMEKLGRTCPKKRQWNYERWKALSKQKTNFDWFHFNRKFCKYILNFFLMDKKPTTKIWWTSVRLSKFIESVSLPLFLQQRLTKESRNAMKMKRTLNFHFVFVFTAMTHCPFWWAFLKVAIQWKWKGLPAVILALSK